FEGTLLNANYQKEKLYDIFSKMYEKMGYNTEKLDKLGIINGKDNIFKNNDFKTIFSEKFNNSNGLDFELLKDTLLNNNKPKEKTPNKINTKSQEFMYA
ncbi:MAG: hypothetical protein NWP80_00105, partial [Candidatus Gracilibacteria bacterium]|nr:hypothetical protein [Candidatus Gracilibacteria bacterium]